MNAIGNCAGNASKCGDLTKMCCQSYTVTEATNPNAAQTMARTLMQKLGFKTTKGESGSICSQKEKGNNGKWSDEATGLSFEGTCSKAKALIGGVISAAATII